MLAVACGALHLPAEFLGPQFHVYVFNPLTTFTSLELALTARPAFLL